ncbi:MAG: RNA polymerase sigma factor [Verrucomicrobiaceae bacterium]|nr:MAG: RNA polymerase sigma factor [Verrucomicrobiaceae bacterium]
MDVSRATDTELLEEWVTHRSEPAFQALVARYAGLVHMAARRTSGSEDVAAETSQLVFILLAQKAKSLVSHTTLAGWLHVTSVMQAKNLLRKSQQENRKRDQLLDIMETGATAEAQEAWLEMQPVLDGALAALSAQDREALLLRFYRSLSIREVATTLGIATSAAQKRVDRATERLREKLTQRGCHAGGSMALALVTGFASDTQAAAVLVPALTTKAVAAGAATTVFSSTLIPLTLMKTSTYIPPVVALILSAMWLTMQNQSLAALEKGNEELAARLDAPAARRTVTASSTAGPARRLSRNTAPRKAAGTPGAGGIDWQEFAEMITASRASTAPMMFDGLRFNRMMEADLKRMSREELVAAYREVAALDAPESTLDVIQTYIATLLCRRFPEYALTQLTDHLSSGGSSSVGTFLGEAFLKWYQKDATAATTWLDGQIAAGTFENGTLSGYSYLRSAIEGNVITALLASDPAMAARRLEALPLKHRLVPFGKVEPENLAAFAELVRSHLSKENGIAAIEYQLHHVPASLKNFSTYIRNIRATPEELNACVLKVVSIQVSYAALNQEPQDFPGLRAWADSQIPGSADRVIGSTLGSWSNLLDMGFAEAARLAEEQAKAGDADAVLAAFLESGFTAEYKEAARGMAAKISDAATRERILKKLQ